MSISVLTARGTDMCFDFSTWLGRSAIFDISIGDSRFPVYGRVVNATGKDVRIRIAGCLELDIPKEWIVDVQPDVRANSRPASPAPKKAGNPHESP
jgi:hypothetical protein